MKRIMLAAMLAVGGSLATAGIASANVGDIISLTAGVSDASADNVTVEGQVECDVSLQYGIITKVAQPGTGVAQNSDANSPAEGVGAFGPAFEGVQDDQPCDTNGTAFDVTVEKNAESDDFEEAGTMGIGYRVQAATTADNGDRGPGPIIGDLEEVSQASDTDFDFELPIP